MLFKVAKNDFCATLYCMQPYEYKENFKSKKVLQNEKGADKQLLSVHIQNIYYFAFFTVSVIFTDLVLPFFKVTVALIVTVPAFLVVIVPFLFTVATDFLLVL